MKIKYNTTIVLVSMLLFGCANKQQRLIDKADAYYNKGIHYTTSGNDDLAMKYYDSALIYHERIEYYGMRGATKNDYGDYDGAISDFQKGIALDSVSSAALLVMKTLIDAYMSKSDCAKVIYYAKKMNQIKPFSISFSDIAGMYYLIGDYKNALINFGQAITTQTASQPIETAYMMGDCYMRLGDIKSAKEYWIATDSLGYQPSRLKLDSLKRINQ